MPFPDAALASLPIVPLVPAPSAVEELPRLREFLGGAPRLLVKRDDAIGFAFGGNKVRKMAFVAAAAVAEGADTLITCGGVQSNHARVTAITAARLGLRCVLVANGTPGGRLTGNALLDRLAGADLRYVPTREDRAPAMEQIAADVRRAGGRPYVIPLGASVPLGAAAFVAAVAELLAQIDPPDVILHASSSGGTQAGLIAGCLLAAAPTRVIGVSADDPASALADRIRGLLAGLGHLLKLDPARLAAAPIEVDDGFVGEGYGVPTIESQDAIELCARREGLFLDPTYTAKAMAGLIAHWKGGTFDGARTVLFWHTGGQVGLFA